MVIELLMVIPMVITMWLAVVILGIMAADFVVEWRRKRK